MSNYLIQKFDGETTYNFRKLGAFGVFLKRQSPNRADEFISGHWTEKAAKEAAAEYDRRDRECAKTFTNYIRGLPGNTYR